MADTPAITYLSSVPPIEGKKLVCKRCKREYAYPAVDAKPIRCECGWWYFNDGVSLREAFWQRISPYRMPPELARLFKIE